ncbi:MAG: ribonuclease D [Acidimicrobiales bacterium]
MVDDARRLGALCEELAGEEYYAVDTEFHTERTYWPQLALIQLGWGDEVALVDPLAVDPTPLGRVFAGPGTAVAHAAGQDLDVLERACGAVPTTVFDTQIAASFLGMSSPSLARLAEQLLGIVLPKTDRLSDWLHRPISDRQKAYAAGDVVHLLALRATMVEQLVARGRLAWALDECALALADRGRRVVPEERWWRMGDVRKISGRSRGVAQEVAAWRERRAAALDRPRRSVLSDLALTTIVQRPPRGRSDLQELRGVDARHLSQGAADEILEAVRRGLALGLTQLRLPPELGEARAPPAAVAVCAGLVHQLADDLQFDQRLLATRADIALLLCGEPSRLDVGWRSAIAGDPIRHLLGGKVVAAFEPDGRLVLEPRWRPGDNSGPPAAPAVTAPNTDPTR